MRTFRHLPPFGLVTVLLWAALASPADSAELSEYDLKALYLYHFTKFVSWPEGAVSASEPIVIGIIGSNPLGNRLERIIPKQASMPGAVAVKQIHNLEEARNCHILFISRSEMRNLRNIISAVDELPVLTVGDDYSFALRGCVMGFYTENNKVRIAINERAANEANLTLSSKLLRIANAR